MEVDIPAALAALAPKLGGTGVEKAQRLTGGASMETWAFTLLGAGEPQPLILRRRAIPLDPETSRSASMAAEAALILAAGHAGAPVAPLVRLCEPEDGLGE